MTSSFRPKLWLGLGLCVLAPGAVGDAAAQPAGAPPALEDGEGGEGGEGGERGIEADRAATDPVAFLGALDVIAAHVLAARDAYAAGEAQAAGELFAHPIAEVYVGMEPVFAALGVSPFRDDMQRASDLALDRAPAPQVAAAAATVLDALRAAEARTPGRGATPRVQAAAVANMLDRASLQHAAAARDPAALEPYLDGYGLLQAARWRAERALPALDGPERAEDVQAIRSTLDTVARAYPSPVLPQGPSPVPSGELLAQTGRLKLRLGSGE